MTEEIIKECKNCDALGIDSEIGVYYCSLSHRQDDLPKEFTCNDFTPSEQLKRLEQENKSLYEEKNCLHKIIDRLLENAGYSKDIASAEDFEDVYEDMQRKINELAELEQENRQMKSALEEIRVLATKNVSIENFVKIQNKINEVLE